MIGYTIGHFCMNNGIVEEIIKVLCILFLMLCVIDLLKFEIKETGAI